MFVNMLLTTLFLQMPLSSGYGLGLDAVETGLWMVPNAAAFGLMAPISARLTRQFGPATTLLCGAAVMSASYAGRVFLSDNLTQVVLGSVAVAIGTALAYGAMPTLIMRAVPVTETASANGLNVLIRSIGTSSASATTAAVTSALVITTAGRSVPSLHGVDLLFWAASVTAAGAAVLAVPMLRMRDFAEEADRTGTDRASRPATVVRGRVLDAEAHPIRAAVVTVLHPDGTPVDWAQADSAGHFTVAIPRAADYLVVTTADGWRPRSRIMALAEDTSLPPLVLRDRLTLTGTITDAGGRPVSNALVVLTRHSGEAVDSLRTDHDGGYEIPRPTNGRYVLTVVASDGSIGARTITVWEAARSADLVLGTPLA